MGVFKDLTGLKFGRLTVIKFLGERYWLCQCECGNYSNVYSSNLKNKHCQSCGCLQEERRREASVTHGLRYSSEYLVWQNMIKRCHNPRSDHYRFYGERGIVVCDEWRGKGGFANFYKCLGPRPSEKHSIERINVNGNYEPSNCKWIENSLQANNKASTIKVWFKNEITPLAVALRAIGIDRSNYGTHKYRKGLTDQEAFNHYALPKSKLLNHSFGHIT